MLHSSEFGKTIFNYVVLFCYFYNSYLLPDYEKRQISCQVEGKDTKKRQCVVVSGYIRKWEKIL